MAILRLITQKGLSMECRKKAKELERVSAVLEDLRQREGSEEPNALKAEREQSLEIFEKAKKEHDVAVASTYELLRNLFSGDAQTQWDRIDREMHERDSWAGVNGAVTKGQRQRSWVAFKDCVEPHKLTVFPYDAAERQKYYMQQSVRKARTCHYTSVYDTHGDSKRLPQASAHAQEQPQGCCDNEEG